MAEGDPPEKDVKDFEFRQLVKCRLYPPPAGPLPAKRLQQLAVSSKFDLIFAASNNELKVLRLRELSQCDERMDARERSTAIIDVPCDRQTTVGGVIVHLAVSSDDLMLAVVTDDDTCLTLLLFDLPALASPTAAGFSPFAHFPLSSGRGVALRDLSWNPALPSLLAVCDSDGHVILLDVANAVTAKVAAPLSATCLSWSPKGKQIMVGKGDGSCTQYDHDLQLKYNWPAPPTLSEPHQVTDMVWISTYTYLASYLPHSADSTVQPVVMMTVSSKEKNTRYISYDDVCFGSGEEQKPKYFFQYLAQWELIVTSSCSATETAIIARHLDDKTRWEHWNLEDSSRAELPVTDNQTDSYPVGMGVIFSSQQLLQLGDSKTHPPCPILLLLSTDGVLVPFHVAYFHPQAPILTTPPQPLPPPSARSSLSASVPGMGSVAGASHHVPQPASAPPPPQSSAPSLAGLLTSLPLAAAPPVAQSAVGSGQPGAGKSLFGQPVASPGSVLGQPASSPASAFSFASPEGVGGVASSVASADAATKPMLGFGLGGGGLTGKSLFGAFNAAASGSAGGAKPLSFAAPANSGAGDTGAKPFSFATQPSAPTPTPTPTKPTADKPSLLGHAPGGGLGGVTAPASSSGLGGVTAPAASSSGFGGITAPASSGLGGVMAPVSSGLGGVMAPASSGFGGITAPAASSGLGGVTAPASSGFGGITAPVSSSGLGGVTAPAASSGLGGVTAPAGGGGGSGQFSFSFKPATSTTPSPFPPSAHAASSVTAPSTAFVPHGQSSGASLTASASTVVAVPTPAAPTPAAPQPAAAAPAASFSTPPASLTPAASFSTPAASLTPAAPVASFSTPGASLSTPARVVVSSGMTPGAGSGVTGAPTGGRSGAEESREEREIEAILNYTISQNIAEEMEDFERELQGLKQRMSRPGPVIGSKEEMQTLCQTTLKLGAFCKEITAMTKEHCREMYDIKGGCVDLFSMAEECRCRQQRNHDPQYLRALQLRALDPATASRMRRLSQSAQQITQAMSDVDDVLDSQWEAHREKEKKTRIYIPNSDTLYRAIRSNHKVLVSGQHSMECVQDKLRRLQVKNTTTTWDNFPLHRAAARTPSAPGGAAAAALPRDWRLKKADLLTPEKVSLLKESLAKHQVRKIKCQPLVSLAQSRLVSLRAHLTL
ncbi:hypothetical protein ACOMHN_048152 [Nucella lapillus]